MYVRKESGAESGADVPFRCPSAQKLATNHDEGSKGLQAVYVIVYWLL